MPMRQDGEWFVLEVPQAGAGTRYRFRIVDDIEIPDPASHFQPEEVHGPSEVIDHTYRWQCGDWKGRPWSEAVFLEAHVGTFTPEGTFRAVMERLDHLAATGITAVLSRSAGAARELDTAVQIDPNDIEDITRQIAAALLMSREERCTRWQNMMDVLLRHSIHAWFADLMQALKTSRPSHKTTARVQLPGLARWDATGDPCG